MGTFTPASRPTSRDQMPQQITAISQRIVPRSVLTPATRPCSMSKPVTAVSSNRRVPYLRAPFASAMHVSDGLKAPSEGI